ncbi:hypothetical protein HDU76_009851 [Blyttiomyces sp. JEL0837]|nr:hypothetical protein HDU76_009851 [Blyttiomyces sp. JEL0837]
MLVNSMMRLPKVTSVRAIGLRLKSTHIIPVGGMASAEQIRHSLPAGVKSHLEDFSSVITIPVAWGEMDIYKHLNNVHYMRYFESGRIAYFDQVIGANLDEQSYRDFIDARTVGPILKSASIKYIYPVVYPDTLTIGVKVDPKSVQKDRFTQSFKAVSHVHNKVVASGEAVIVCFDYEKQRKADIPDAVLAAFKKSRDWKDQ